VGCKGDFVAVELDKNRALLQSGFVGLNLAVALVKRRPPNDSSGGTANAP
jgi:hypothetical protein